MSEKTVWRQILKKCKKVITPWFVLVQIADVILITLIVLWMFGYISGLIVTGFVSLYISVFIVREIWKIKEMISDAKTNQKKGK